MHTVGRQNNLEGSLFEKEGRSMGDYRNPRVLSRFDDLIEEGKEIVRLLKASSGALRPEDAVKLTQWTTSCLNLLDKLSVSTNRFVREFERYAEAGVGMTPGFALGVLESARAEYHIGLAIDYHLSVAASVFDGLLDQAKYLLEKGYPRAASVIGGSALEEGLKERARAEGVEFSDRDGIMRMVHKLKNPEIGVLNRFEADKLEGCAKLRNDAAHGGDFHYTEQDVANYLQEIEAALSKLFAF
jgi:hypothetical protein